MRNVRIGFHATHGYASYAIPRHRFQISNIIDSRTEDVDVIVNGTASQKPSTITISADRRVAFFLPFGLTDFLRDVPLF
jgi:hypothetical protein